MVLLVKQNYFLYFDTEKINWLWVKIIYRVLYSQKSEPAAWCRRFINTAPFFLNRSEFNQWNFKLNQKSKKGKKKKPAKLWSSVSVQDKLLRNNMEKIVGIGIISYFNRIIWKILADCLRSSAFPLFSLQSHRLCPNKCSAPNSPWIQQK